MCNRVCVCDVKCFLLSHMDIDSVSFRSKCGQRIEVFLSKLLIDLHIMVVCVVIVCADETLFALCCRTGPGCVVRTSCSA